MGNRLQESGTAAQPRRSELKTCTLRTQRSTERLPIRRMHATASRCNILGEKNGIRFVSLASRDAIVIETPITDLIARARNSASSEQPRETRSTGTRGAHRWQFRVVACTRLCDCIKRSDPRSRRRRRDHRARAEIGAGTRPSKKPGLASFSENTRLFGRERETERGTPFVYASYPRSILTRAVIPITN